MGRVKIMNKDNLHKYTHALIAALIILNGIVGVALHNKINESIALAQAICHEIETIPVDNTDG